MRLFVIFIAIFTVLPSFGLTNGQTAISDDLQSVVFIASEARDPSDGSSVQGYCNATFVHPLVLVTAAHCIQDAQAVKSFSVEVTVGKYKFVTRPDGAVVRIGYVEILKETKPATFIFTANVAAKISNQGLQTKIGPQEDVALIVLASPMNLPNSVKMMSVISQQELRGLASNVTAYMPTVVTINPFAEISNTDTKRFATLDSIKWESAGYFQSTSTARVEEGDSGSPLLVKVASTWKIVGVVMGMGKTFFGNWDVFSGLDGKICEMAAQVKSKDVQTLLCY